MGMQNQYYRRKQLLWGLLLISIGVLFLFERLDLLVFDLDRLWQYWPAILLVLGVNKLLTPSSPRRILGGLWLIFIGIWLYGSIEELWGLSFFNSWPALLIAWGAGLVLEPMLDQYFKEKEHQHAKQE